jgi:hypothetical protein
LLLRYKRRTDIAAELLMVRRPPKFFDCGSRKLRSD